MKSNQFSVFISQLSICKILFILNIVAVLSACEEVIDINLNNAQPKLVVEGWIYNTPGPYKIKLSKSTNYFDNEKPPVIENALVIISEDNTVFDTLNMTRPGVYQTQKILQGKVGATYQLKVFYNNEVYESIATMKPLAALDSITYRYESGSVFRDEGYYITTHFQDPPTVGDYYRWKFYLNDKIHKPKNLLYASDELYNGNYISFEFSYDFDLNDTVRVEMFSIEKNMYEYLRGLDEQENTGDLFDTPPGNAQGNISNGALGYFGASAKEVKEIVIE
jgi:hypothetical protein